MKAGDSITISATVPVALTQYDRLKVGGSITRVIGDDPETDLQEMRAGLQAALVESLHMQVDAMGVFADLVAETDDPMQALKDFCERAVARGFDEAATLPSKEPEYKPKRVKRRVSNG